VSENRGRQPVVLDDEALERLLVEAGPPAPSPEVEIGLIEEAARSAWRRRYAWRARRRRALNWGLAAAAALVLAVAGFLVARGERPRPAAAAARWATVERAAGTLEARDGEGGWRGLAPGESVMTGGELRLSGSAGARLSLADGHAAWLDRGSRLRVAAADRIELAAGAIYLDSGAGGEARRLAVVTALGTFTEVGTRFEVRLDGGRARVAVREGEVAYRGVAGAARARAGEALRVDRSGGVERSASPLSGSQWDWVVELVDPPQIDGWTLARFLDWSSRASGLRVEYADAASAAAARETTLHGSVAGLGLEEAVAAAVASAGFAATRDGGVMRVRALD